MGVSIRSFWHELQLLQLQLGQKKKEKTSFPGTFSLRQQLNRSEVQTQQCTFELRWRDEIEKYFLCQTR